MIVHLTVSLKVLFSILKDLIDVILECAFMSNDMNHIN